MSEIIKANVKITTDSSSKVAYFLIFNDLAYKFLDDVYRFFIA